MELAAYFPGTKSRAYFSATTAQGCRLGIPAAQAAADAHAKLQPGSAAASAAAMGEAASPLTESPFPADGSSANEAGEQVLQEGAVAGSTDATGSPSSCCAAEAAPVGGAQGAGLAAAVLAPRLDLSPEHVLGNDEDIIDWAAVRVAPPETISELIKCRSGQTPSTEPSNKRISQETQSIQSPWFAALAAGHVCLLFYSRFCCLAFVFQPSQGLWVQHGIYFPAQTWLLVCSCMSCS